MALPLLGCSGGQGSPGGPDLTSPNLTRVRLDRKSEIVFDRSHRGGFMLGPGVFLLGAGIFLLGKGVFQLGQGVFTPGDDSRSLRGCQSG
jgi:hypothetical protein